MGVVHPTSANRLGPYELCERIGSGGMAEVYVARRAGPRGFAKKFAIKRILPQLAKDPRFVEMFCDEARICAALSHPNIVQVVDFGEDNGELFMALEFVDGTSLAKLLRAVAARGQRFPAGAALFIAVEVLRGLGFAHDACDEHGRRLGIVHRDVSPGNILLGRAGEVKLTDFGIVRSEFIARRTYPGELKGKLGYMSPEQVMGHDVCPRSDLFTVGIVLAEMLMTRPLFPGPSEMQVLTRIHEADLSVLQQHGRDIPPAVREVLNTALARDRHHRFASASDFVDALLAAAKASRIPIGEEELVPWLYTQQVFHFSSGTRAAVAPVSDPDAVTERPPAPKVPAAARRSLSQMLARASASSLPLPVEVDNDTDRPALIPPGPEAAARPRQMFLLGRQGRPAVAVSVARLLEMAMTGHLERDALVSEDGKSYGMAGRYTKLVPVLSHPGYRFRERVEERASFRVTIDRSRLPAILFDLASSRATGLLVARAGRREKRLFLVDGGPRFLASTDRRELLSVRLVEAGLVSRELVERALVAAFEQGSPRFGEYLRDVAGMRWATVLRATVEQLEAGFVELGTWREGELLFVHAERCPEELPRKTLSGSLLAARAIREGYADAEIAALLAPFYGSRLSEGSSLLDLDELGLGPGERRAVELGPNAGSVEALVSHLGATSVAGPTESLRAVFIALAARVLEIE